MWIRAVVADHPGSADRFAPPSQRHAAQTASKYRTGAHGPTDRIKHTHERIIHRAAVFFVLFLFLFFNSEKNDVVPSYQGFQLLNSQSQSIHLSSSVQKSNTYFIITLPKLTLLFWPIRWAKATQCIISAQNTFRLIVLYMRKSSF